MLRRYINTAYYYYYYYYVELSWSMAAILEMLQYVEYPKIVAHIY